MENKDLYVRPSNDGEVRVTTKGVASEYKPVRASQITETQLDRIEKKVDRILELLESKDLSTTRFFPIRASSVLEV
ncbi:adenylylsulfate kinase-like enzyme [Pullulanibacillus pueri]|uniref:Uncharacterized protein n=1 Tax=Pullulanibacillus pueri TaxID=1437324 RepID=A0A8J2ZWX4_9BACL|nr:adenylylsulfate kinase-like enzyme [Pullulanibacillus pueri]GGH83524.1 hypothetical protein GCM10007096_24520 [Pullulanibacillus pueri]